MTTTTTGKRWEERVPTSTWTQARVVLYQPSQRPERRTGDWQTRVTDAGERRVRVVGRLGQRHADVLEAICYTALRRRNIDDGGIELLVDPHQVRRVMSGGRGQYSSEQLHVLLADLRAAVIEIETPELAKQGQRIIGGLIDHWIPSSRTVTDPLSGGVRQLWRVRLGVALAALIRADGGVWRDPAPIARLESGVSQAVARHILTQRAPPLGGGWTLGGLLDAVGIEPSDRRNARRRLRQDAAGLAVLGIEIDGDRVRRCKAGGVEDAA